MEALPSQTAVLAEPETPSAPRPESLLLAFLGAHLLHREDGVAIASVIDVLGRLGVGEHATRATLKRMGQRGLLNSTRQGRRVFISPSDKARAVLQEGGIRLDASVTERSWDGRWILLSFSIPESRREDRHTLRTRLRWAGFGPLRSGLWVAPSCTDFTAVLEDPALAGFVRVFRAEAVAPADARLIADEAWDLSALADDYRAFLEHWPDAQSPDSMDDLCAHMLLVAQWLLIIRHDPNLPRDLLPDDWPGLQAASVFGSLHHRLIVSADRLAEECLDWAPHPTQAAR